MERALGGLGPKEGRQTPPIALESAFGRLASLDGRIKLLGVLNADLFLSGAD